MTTPPEVPSAPEPRRPLEGRARPVAAALSLLSPLWWVALLVGLVLGLLGGAGWWLLKTAEGTRWLLDRVPNVHVQGVRGALLDDKLAAERVHVTWSQGKASVTVTGFAAEGLRWQFFPRTGLWVGIDATRLVAREVTVDTGPPSGQAPTVPQSLRIPLRVASPDVQIEELRIDRIGPWKRVRGNAAVSDDDAYRLRNTRFEWDRLTVQGDARLGMSAPLVLEGAVQLTPADGQFGAGLKASGNLSKIVLDATLRGPAAPGREAPAADVHAEILPFAPWWLGALNARTQALDLSALSASLPETRLAGSAEVKTQSHDAPVQARIALDNTLPGRWDEQRLPVRRLALDVAGSAVERQRIELSSFDLQLGSGRQDAGRVRGRGLWNGHGLEMSATLEALRPQALDGRAAAMTLAGPLAFTVQGLPSPTGGTPPPLAITLRATLDGRLDAAPQPVQLALDAQADDHRIEIRELRARSGNALAQLAASAREGAQGELLLATTGTLTDFDPLPWWPGIAGSAWRQGLHRLSGNWQLDLRVPPHSRRLAPLALLQQLSGSGRLRVTDSQLAGVPVALDLTLAQAPSPGGTPSSLTGELQVAGNTLKIDGHGNPLGAGQADRVRLDLNAPALPALAPLVRLVPELAAYAPRSGSARGSFSAQGRWPVIQSEGQAELDKLEAGPVGVARGSLRWQLQFDGEGRQPLELKAELAGMRLGSQRAELLRAELQGTPRDHKLLVNGALPLSPPAWSEQLFGLRALSGSRAQLQAEGAWEPATGGGGRWRGRVARLAVGAWDGRALEGDAPASWVDGRDLSAELDFDAEGRLQRVQAEPGRLRLADALALRWEAVRVDLRGSSPQIDLRADVDTFLVAPLLARLQPSFGWQGDLALGARIELRAAERFDADIVLERRAGDLQVVDETGTQALGLSDLRLALAAHDGQWVFSQGLAGRALGEVAGALSVSTTPQRRWPGPDAPMEGVLQARVASLGVWGAWVPAGWRLTGEMRTSATIGGRWGAPEYTGQVVGKDLGVRNLLQGVHVSNGQVGITLKGESAQIDTFTFKGGEGSLAITGGAQFGSTPSARLQLKAERFRVLGRIDRNVIASGQATLSLKPEQVQLDGGFGIDEGLIDVSRSDAPALDDDVSVRRASDPAQPTEAAAPPKARRDVAVAVDVDLGRSLRLRGRGLDTALEGKLRITTPQGRLAVQGTVNTEGGTYAAYGQKLDIERGIVAFSGVPDNPRLDILALRPNTDVRVGVQITGNLLTPRVRLYSETDLSDTDKLSWLVLGRASDGLGRADTALLQRAAVALLAGEGEAPTDTLMKNIGIDELSLRQSDGDVRETVISLGKQLSRRWYVGYERGVNATTGTWQLIYRIAQRFTLRAQSGQENSLDIIWTWKFDEIPLPAVVRKSQAVPP